VRPAFLIVPGVLVYALAIACGSSPVRPTAQSPSSAPVAGPSVNVNGTWSGTANDSQGTTVVSWALSQDGSAVSGTVTTRAVNPTDGSCSSCHRNKSGTVTATASGNTLTLTMAFAAGVNGDPTPACSATLTGTASTVAADQISGTYSGSDTCEGRFNDGTLTLSRSR
jgi:hypothetical protein